MNTPNINAEQLPLPPGHRWVDIANEPFTWDAKFCCAGSWTRDHDPDNASYALDWSYCVPVNAKTLTPEPETKPDFTGHALALPDPDTCAMLLDAADLYDATRMSGDLDNVDWTFPPDLCAWASQNRDALEAGTKPEAGR